jgi:hypothetical protein
LRAKLLDMQPIVRSTLEKRGWPDAAHVSVGLGSSRGDLGTVAELGQQYTNGTLTGNSAERTILPGLAAEGTAGISKVLEVVAEPATTAGSAALVDPLTYKGTMYGLNTLAGTSGAIPAIPELGDPCP